MATIKKPSVYAFIPARGGSKGIPRKNLADLAGKPLIAHAIAQADAAKEITQVFVSSEDAEIRGVALSYGAEVIDRPEEFIHDNSIQEVDRLLRWTVLDLEAKGHVIDIVVLLYATSPLREVSTIDEVIRLVSESGYDSALSLYEDTTYLWRKDGEVVAPTNYDPATRGPRQKEQWNQWAENKAVYAVKRDLLINTGCRLGGKIGYVEMPKWRSVDVDKPEDLELVRKLYEVRGLDS
jgi:CMP-N,N'-diacetyllegionaminic acid synthase